MKLSAVREMRKIRLSPKQRVSNRIVARLSSSAIEAKAVAGATRMPPALHRAGSAANPMRILALANTEIVLSCCFSRRFGLFGLFLLLTSYAPQNISQRVIRFVARVFVHVLVRDGPSHFPCPRPCPRGRIFHSKTVEQGPRSRSSEAFDHVQVLRRSTEARFISEVRGIDYQRFA